MQEEGKYLNKNDWKNRRKSQSAIKEKKYDLFVHESSIIDDQVTIGDGTKI